MTSAFRLKTTTCAAGGGLAPQGLQWQHQGCTCYQSGNPTQCAGHPLQAAALAEVPLSDVWPYQDWLDTERACFMSQSR